VQLHDRRILIRVRPRRRGALAPLAAKAQTNTTLARSGDWTADFASNAAISGCDINTQTADGRKICGAP
jgi:hypothetical protein